jgi:hypothetical protein
MSEIESMSELSSKNESGLTADMPLYRTTTFDRFKEMVSEKKLALVSCSKWFDKNEGPLAQKLRTIRGVRLVEEKLEQRRLSLPLMVFEMLRQKTYMQCWTAADEKVRMWEEYSKNRDSVRFTTRLGKIAAVGNVHIYPVEYRASLDLDEEIDRIFPNMGGLSVITMTEIFRRKHVDYDYEEEIRLMHQDYVFSQREDSPGIKKLSFAHIPNFVEGVVLDPRASAPLTTSVEEFCVENSIPFCGRSTLKME